MCPCIRKLPWFFSFLLLGREPTEERGEGLGQRLLSLLLILLGYPAMPGDESIGAYKHRSPARDAIRLPECVPATDEICGLPPDLTAIHREMRGVLSAACTGLPLCS